MRVGVLTVSDRSFRGEREDRGGPKIVAWCEERGYEVGASEIVPDETWEIAARLVTWSDELGVDLVVTTGGTGLTARDVTPEATLAVIDRAVPGIAEEIRRKGLTATPNSIISRGVAGTRGSTLIVNLPGSTGGVADGLEVLTAVVDHAVALLRGEDDGHPGAAAS